VTVTLNSIYWFRYTDWSGDPQTTKSIVIEFIVTNNSGKTIETSPISSWGAILADGKQVDSIWWVVGDPTNFDKHSGYTILDGATVTDGETFEEIQGDPKSFTFRGHPPYHDENYDPIFTDFEFDFTLSDIGDKPL